MDRVTSSVTSRRASARDSSSPRSWTSSRFSVAASWSGCTSPCQRRKRPAPREIDRLYEQLQRASALVVEMFDEHMHKDAQLEKRYMRLLREVSAAALHAGVPALTTGLQQLLELVTEAMGGRGAALLLHNPETDLVTAATAGAEPLMDYAHQRAEGTPRMAAEAEQPGSLWDVSSAPVEVPDSVRRGGIQALLGVELKTRSGLLGMIYIGFAESRELSAREHRRLGSLAEYLVAHLETIVLFERLNTTIQALRAEQSIREHFVSVLAHDLRGPLSAAKLGAALLSQEPASRDTRRELAVRIDRNLDRLDRMIRDLLDANRIRAGERLPLRLDSCDLGQLAQDVAEELRVLHGDRFVVDADDGVRGIWSADELQRALWNLASNAVKYGAPDREIRFVVCRTDGRARVAVHNWGNPIAAEDQVHLFEPFTRTTGAVETGRSGWGLGLTLVRGCAMAHGGSAYVSSNAAEGTTFTIEIPLDARPYQLISTSQALASSPLLH